MTAGAVLVTGATGTVGRHVVTALRARGAEARPGVRSVERAGDCRFDFDDPTTWEPALDGVDRIFLMRPPAISDVKGVIRPFVRFAARRSIRHVAVLSVMGVNPAMPHWRLERDVKATGIGWTMLRPAYFMQNLETAWRASIRDRGVLRMPAGRGRTSFVDTRDVADVAALALCEPDAHGGRAFTLTGGEALEWASVAAALSGELGRTVRYDPISFRTARRELAATGAPAAYVNVQLLISAVARAGLAAKTTDDVRRLLGRPPRRLAAYVHEMRELWR